MFEMRVQVVGTRGDAADTRRIKAYTAQVMAARAAVTPVHVLCRSVSGVSINAWIHSTALPKPDTTELFCDVTDSLRRAGASSPESVTVGETGGETGGEDLEVYVFDANDVHDIADMPLNQLMPGLRALLGMEPLRAHAWKQLEHILLGVVGRDALSRLETRLSVFSDDSALHERARAAREVVCVARETYGNVVSSDIVAAVKDLLHYTVPHFMRL